MKIKNGLLIIVAVCLYGAVLLSLAYAEMKKVDESELSRINASVTGATMTDRTAGIEKSMSRQETVQTVANVDKGEAFVTPSVRTMENLGISLNVRGQETFRFQTTGVSASTTGGATGVKSW